MLLEPKKRLLVPLNNPHRPKLPARILFALIRPPLLVVGFVFGNLYKLFFRGVDERLARKDEQQFADEIRNHLSFLFSEHSAQIVPNEGTPFPPGFDGAFVTVAAGDLLLRFSRGRGNFSVRVASASAPQEWQDFQLVADGIGEWNPRHQHYSLETFAEVLRPRLTQLQEALSQENYESTLTNAVKLHNQSVDEYAAKLRQHGIVPKIL